MAISENEALQVALKIRDLCLSVIKLKSHMNPNGLKPKDEEMLIAEMIESEISRHQQYHRHICNFIMLMEIFTRNKGEMGLLELKGIMGGHWKNITIMYQKKKGFCSGTAIL